MKIVPDDIEPIIKSLEPAAAALSKKTLGFGKSRFEIEVYDHFIPFIALHASLLGATLLVVRFAHFSGSYANAASITFVMTSLVLAIVYLFIRHTNNSVLTGLLGVGIAFLTAAGAFATTSVIEHKLIYLSIYITITLPYLVVATLIAYGVIDSRELRAAPVYSALMISILDSSYTATAQAAYLMAAIAGFASLLKSGRFAIAAGFLVGLAIIQGHVENHTLLIMYNIIVIVGMLAYSALFIRSNRSDIWNLSVESLVVFAIIVLVAWAIPEEPFYRGWLRVAGLGVFAAAVWRYRDASVLPSAFVWLFVLFLEAISFGALYVFPLAAGIAQGELKIHVEEWPKLFSLLCGASVLYVAGRLFSSELVCNIARIFLLAGAVLCMRVAQEVRLDFLELVSKHNAYTWRLTSLLSTFVVVLLAAACVLATYRSSPLRSRLPWWQGFVSARRAVIVRAECRALSKALEKAPIVGEIWKALNAAREIGRFLKTESSRLNISDTIVFIAFIFLTLGLEYLFDTYLLSEHGGMTLGDEKSVLLSAPEIQWWSPIIAWTAVSILIYLGGLYKNQSLFLLAGVGFALVPLIKYIGKMELYYYELGDLLIVLGLVLVFFSIMRLLVTVRSVAVLAMIITAVFVASIFCFRIADRAEAKLARLFELGIDLPAPRNEAEVIDRFRPENLPEVAKILGTLTSLRSLNLFETSVADLAPLKGLTSLEELDLSKTQTVDLAPLKGLNRLRTLKISATQVADLTPLEAVTELQTLDLSNTRVKDIMSLKGMTRLNTLDLSDTEVSDLSPLSGLTALVTLDLSNTHVTDLGPLKALSALQTLNISGTEITDLDPLENAPALKLIIGAPEAEKDRLNDGREKKGLPPINVN